MEFYTLLWVIVSNICTVFIACVIFYFDNDNILMHNLFKFVKSIRAFRQRRQIEKYTPCSTLGESDEKPKCPPDRLIIGLFGNTGVGKSSLINSLKILLSKGGKPSHLAPVASEDIMRGHTLHRNPYDITKYIRVVDNRGMDNTAAQETNQEVKSQLEGHRGYTSPVDTTASSSINIKGENVHLGVLVVRADVTPANYKSVMDFVQGIQESVGRPPCAVITHKDQASSEHINNVKGFLAAVGISDKDVYIVENTHHSNLELDLESKIMLLRFLQQCTEDGDYSIMNYERKMREQGDAERVKQEIALNNEEIENREMLLKKEREEEEQRRMLFEESLAQPRREYEVKMKKIDVQLRQLEMESRKADREAREKEEYQRQQQILTHEKEMKEMEIKNKIRLEQEKENRAREEFERKRLLATQELEKEKIKNKEKEIEYQKKIKSEAIAAQERADKHKADKDNRGFLGRIFGWN